MTHATSSARAATDVCIRLLCTFSSSSVFRSIFMSMTFEIISKQIVSQEQMIHCKLLARTHTQWPMDVHGKVVRHAKGECRNAGIQMRCER